MSKSNAPHQTTFLHTTDDVQAATHRTRDEIEWTKERRRTKKKLPKTPPPPASGPCCFRCQHWHEPEGSDEFGDCRVLGKADDAAPHVGIEKGHIVAIEDVRRARVYADPLRTGPSFTCSAYGEFREEVA